MNGKLPHFMRYAAERPFQWGRFDCGLWLADWYCYATGNPDPASDLRGKYHDAESCRVICGPLGFARMTQRIADRAGLQHTSDPMRGDIGVIRTRPGNVIVGAIRIGTGWAYLGLRGISSISSGEPSLRVLRAWRL